MTLDQLPDHKGVWVRFTQQSLLQLDVDALLGNSVAKYLKDMIDTSLPGYVDGTTRGGHGGNHPVMLEIGVRWYQQPLEGYDRLNIYWYHSPGDLEVVEL